MKRLGSDLSPPRYSDGNSNERRIAQNNYFNNLETDPIEQQDTLSEGSLASLAGTSSREAVSYFSVPTITQQEVINNFAKLNTLDNNQKVNLATNLGKFNNYEIEMQQEIAEAIRKGLFGKEPGVLTTLATSLGKMKISNVAAQRNIANAINDGRFGTATEVLKALATSLGEMEITDWEAQQLIAFAINNGRFGAATEVLKALAASLGKMKISDVHAQRFIADAINNGRFGTATEVLKALAASLGKMTISDVPAQQFIADAINNGRFGTASEVLKALAKSLGTMKISDVAAQQNIAKAINDGIFGTAPEVLKALATSLGEMEITDEDAQRHIVLAIYNSKCKFGTDPEVLKALATSLGEMEITDWEAQELIADAINDGEFGTDPGVLKALAASLGKMKITNWEAQQLIAVAIDNGRFGTATEVLKALAASLGKMKISDVPAQQFIADAINNGRFGTATEVLKALATSLGKINITDKFTQGEIIKAINNGRFDSLNIEKEVLKKYVASHWLVGDRFFAYRDDFIIDSTNASDFAEYYHGAINITYTGIETQMKAGLAFGFVYNLDGKAELLIVYDEKTGGLNDQAKQDRMQGFFSLNEINEVIYKGYLNNVQVFDLLHPWGGYPTKLDLMDSSNYSKFPAWLRLAIDYNKFNLDDYADCNLIQFTLNLAFAKLNTLDNNQKVNLATNLGKFNNYEIEMQQEITEAIRKGLFGKESRVLTTLATSLGTMKISDVAAQQNIANAINDGIFGTAPKVLKALAKSLGKMKITDKDAQRHIALAIYDSKCKFGTDPEVLKALATSLGEMEITDWEAQELIAAAINDGEFGTDPEVLKALAASLGKMKITNWEAQELIAVAINNGRFGTATEVLKALAASLGKMKITNWEAQELIAVAINNGRFGTATEVLKALATSLGEMEITNWEAQQLIAFAINNGRFGTATEVLKALATSLGKMKISDVPAHQFIAFAINNGRFGTATEVLKALATSLGKINITDNFTQREIIKAINNGRFDSLNIEKEVLKKYVASHWLVGDRFFAYRDDFFIAFIDSTNASDFAEYYHGAINITYTGIETQMKAGLAFGFVYNLDGKAELLIVYDEKTKGLNDQAKQDRMQGFFSLNETNEVIYKGYLNNVQVFDLLHPRNEYPTKLDLMDSSNYSKFPGWLRLAIDYNKFNLDDYADCNLIQFTLNLANLAQEPTTDQTDKPAGEPPYSQLVQQLIQRLVTLEGESISLDSDPQKDAEIKDRINASFPVFAECDKTEIDQFWSQLGTPLEKAKLIFLVGQIAKKGALGYHLESHQQSNERNQANDFFSNLTYYYTDKLRSENPANIDKLTELYDGLKNGVCIETLTNDFLIANCSLAQVWSKRSA